MQIYIPSKGRAGKARTYEALTEPLRALTKFVVGKEDADAYLSAFGKKNVLVTPAKGIAATRQWILERQERGKLVMLDDDLTFGVKNGSRIIRAEPKHVNSAFEDLETLLEKFAHASICPRALNFACESRYVYNSRMMHVLAYDVKKVLKAGASFTKGVSEKFSMDDFHMTLQLLSAGFSNCIIMWARTNPSASNSVGGASLWRNLQTQNASAKALQKFHGKEVVKVLPRKAWEGMDGERLDVRISWRKTRAARNH